MLLELVAALSTGCGFSGRATPLGLSTTRLFTSRCEFVALDSASACARQALLVLGIPPMVPMIMGC